MCFVYIHIVHIIIFVYIMMIITICIDTYYFTNSILSVYKNENKIIISYILKQTYPENISS